MVWLLAFLLLFIIVIFLFMQQPMFGKTPAGERLIRIQQSPNYEKGSFQNKSFTPNFTDGANFFSVLKDFLFTKSPSRKPSQPLPSIKTDLLSLDPGENVLVWMGHSSYFIQADGKKILVDPVLSGNASPLSSGTKAFDGADIYKTTDIPAVDFLFITHDHWDHLDYKVVTAIAPRVQKIITGLGTGEHLQRWGIDARKIIEKDWNETIALQDRFTVTVTPARHFSGRGLIRNRALWVSFVLQTPNRKIFIGGDSGYDSHFTAIGKEHGPFDLAILECGQYNKSWKHIHMMPEETVQAAIDLKAKMLLPVHWSKFTLSLHSWKEPAERVTQAAAQHQMPLLTPMIGEKLQLDKAHTTMPWWQHV